jgi:mannose/cellobiose epimerase-like protein (N-acyl-D-glucosamine 2-epimerase family)
VRPFLLPENLAVDQRLLDLIERYRATYLDYFLAQFDAARTSGRRGGFFNINSVTGQPYPHSWCYSWTDGRSLGEFSAARLAAPGDADRLDAYIEHLHECLVQRYERNGYFPHLVDDATNLAVDDPMNVKLGPDQSSFSHIFVLNGFFQYALLRDSRTAWSMGMRLLDELETALSADRFLEGAAPRPAGQRAQGPFMIALGACADILESLAALHGANSTSFQERAGRFLELGRRCIQQILANHLRLRDHAFWEVSQDGQGVRDEEGRVVTDPGHTIEFSGFAGRFAPFIEHDAGVELRQTARRIFRWAATVGFHPQRDLIYKNVDRDTGIPIRDALVHDIAARVSSQVFEQFYRGCTEPVRVATFPWWVPMELVATASVLRQGDDSGQVDAHLLRAVAGIFTYYPNERIGGLCYQNMADGYFQYLDMPPAVLALDLMHSHRSMRVFLRQMGAGR